MRQEIVSTNQLQIVVTESVLARDASGMVGGHNNLKGVDYESRLREGRLLLFSGY